MQDLKQDWTVDNDIFMALIFTKGKGNLVHTMFHQCGPLSTQWPFNDLCCLAIGLWWPLVTEATRHLLLPTCSTRFTTMARARSQSTTTLCPLSSTSLAGSGWKEAWGAHTNHKSTSSSQGLTSPQRRVDKIKSDKILSWRWSENIAKGRNFTLRC